MAINTFTTLKTAIADEIDYNPNTGDMVWKKSGRGRFKRKGVSCSNKPVANGYIHICVNNKQWLAHRLAWVLHYGEEPPRVIDHINRDKTDNRIANLRDGTNGVNEMNTKIPKNSPFKIIGVRRASKKGNYQAYIAKRGAFKSFYHGPDFFEACCARKSYDAKYWDEVA
jgi:hypothetical protein